MGEDVRFLISLCLEMLNLNSPFLLRSFHDFKMGRKGQNARSFPKNANFHFQNAGCFVTPLRREYLLDHRYLIKNEICDWKARLLSKNVNMLFKMEMRFLEMQMRFLIPIRRGRLHKTPVLYSTEF